MPKRYCPNCRAELTDENYCEGCDTEFSITQKEARVKKQGALADLSDRLAKVEQQVFSQPAEPEPEPEPDEQDDDGEIFPRQ